MAIKIELNEEQEKRIVAQLLERIHGTEPRVTGGDLVSHVKAQPTGTQFVTRDVAKQFSVSGHSASRQFVGLKSQGTVKMIRRGLWKRT